MVPGRPVVQGVEAEVKLLEELNPVLRLHDGIMVGLDQQFVLGGMVRYLPVGTVLIGTVPIPILHLIRSQGSGA